MRIKYHTRGSVIMLVLVFGSVFLILLSGLLSFLTLQYKQSVQKVSWNESLEIAESGIQYAKWHFAHAPADYGFGGLYSVKDPEGDSIGKYQLEITAPSGCDSSARIRSTGWTLQFPNMKRIVQVKYAKSSFAKYAFLTNSNAWFGSYESLRGPLHSNNGVRMDGAQNALATSAVATYTCDESQGCVPSQTKPGIWGAGDGGTRGLWQFPVSNIDFDAITQDLSALRSAAQASGIYLPQLGLGYHVKFKNDGTIDVYRVKNLQQKVWGWDMGEWKFESNNIQDEDFYQNYPLPANCAPIFVGDNVWVDGIVNGRVTLVSGKLPEVQNNNPKIIINGAIDYANQNSTLGLIGQQDIIIPLYSPNDLYIKANMLAQKGHVMRYYYPNWDSEPYKTYALRNSIHTYGSIITNLAFAFAWGDSGNVVSGYKESQIDYDSRVPYNPPPYFPLFGDYEVMEWKEL